MLDVHALKLRAIAEVDKLRAEAEEIAIDIHAHPEVGWDTPRSSNRLADYMERHGMDVERGVADLTCAFRASAKGRKGQRTAVAMLAEFDALAGMGHGCSHNLIGTAACTAGIAVSRVMGDIAGNVFVMGTPNEEGGGGKVLMVERGIFDDVDASMLFHGGDSVKAGIPNIACTQANYRFYGKPVHAGMTPHLGINAADAAMLTFAGVNALRQHVRSDARIHGIITQGGDAANIVPEFAEVVMLVRALDQGYVSELMERVHNCARAGALATGARLEIEMGMTYAERIVLSEFRDVLVENIKLVGVEPPDGDPQSYASSDTGNVSYHIPHLHMLLPLDTKGSVPHTTAFVEASNSEMGRQSMISAAKIMATTAIDLLTDPVKMAAIKEQHRVELAKKLRA